MATNTVDLDHLDIGLSFNHVGGTRSHCGAEAAISKRALAWHRVNDRVHDRVGVRGSLVAVGDSADDCCQLAATVATSIS